MLMVDIILIMEEDIQISGVGLDRMEELFASDRVVTSCICSHRPLHNSWFDLREISMTPNSEVAWDKSWTVAPDGCIGFHRNGKVSVT